jgi:hypothetical protein
LKRRAEVVLFLRFLEAGFLRTKSVSFPDLVVFSEMLLKKEAEDPFETKSSKFLEGRKTRDSTRTGRCRKNP